VSEAAEQAYRELERGADALKLQDVRGGIDRCKAEAKCHAAAAACYAGGYRSFFSDLGGNPMTVASAVSNALLFEKGYEMGAVLTHWSPENIDRQRAARRAEMAKLVPLVHCIFGNPFRPAYIDPGWLTWNGATVKRLAEAAYHDLGVDRALILADALEDAGCADAGILTHLRDTWPRVRGCWALDLLLKKE
jgi:hypothetical protein